MGIGNWSFPVCDRVRWRCRSFFVTSVVTVVGVIFDKAGGEPVEHDAEHLVFTLAKRFDLEADVFAEGAVEAADVNDLGGGFGNERRIGDGAERGRVHDDHVIFTLQPVDELDERGTF